jgi:uncharacterized protein
MLGGKEGCVDTDWLDYPTIIQEALRDAVRRVLAQVAEDGLPGEHHFYIGFQPDAPGVVVPKFLRDLYPEEVRIILQHQFWDLAVEEEQFSVTLSFNGQRQHLTVPFAAVTLFADPEAEFTLRFDEAHALREVQEGGELAADDQVPSPLVGPRAVPNKPEKPAEVLRFDPTRRK